MTAKTDYEFHEKGLLDEAVRLSAQGASDAWIVLALTQAKNLPQAHSNMFLLGEAFAILENGGW